MGKIGIELTSAFFVVYQTMREHSQRFLYFLQIPDTLNFKF